MAAYAKARRSDGEGLRRAGEHLAAGLKPALVALCRYTMATPEFFNTIAPQRTLGSASQPHSVTARAERAPR